MVGNNLGFWTSPKRKDVAKGRILEIWSASKTDPDRKYEGRARLILPDPGWRGEHGLPYLAYEEGGKKHAQKCYIWTWERWLIEWVESDTYRIGDRTHRHIHFFLCRNWKYPSGYIRQNFDPEPFSSPKEKQLAEKIHKEHFNDEEE